MRHFFRPRGAGARSRRGPTAGAQRGKGRGCRSAVAMTGVTRTLCARSRFRDPLLRPSLR
ncbi:hypothetical protein HMPREF1318_2000 [Actinomyces massiliensis F0489]|uniref:Uncharacterized protein n=1 Tax=Actinomyces massiliensis F0489 TaxID=1125718 RepID=J0NGR6_9ACTO|nr:hypothetical protein HMPREF1318_2000 [Actinomyces massiliensis F0489]